MVKAGSLYKFNFPKLTKGWRKDETPPCLELRAYLQDKDLCVMTCLDEDLKRSTLWLEKGQSQLLLSRLKPHKEIQMPNLAGWV